MAEEEKKEKVDAASQPREKVEQASSETRQDAASTQDAAEKVDAASQPREKVDAASLPREPAEPDWKDLYARLKADFDNYKKRAARDRDDVYRYAESDILGDILPTVDNLALALANAKDQDDPFVKGVKLAYDTLIKSLKDHGAEPFDSVGKELDTEKMEAITMMPSADVAEGKVVAEVKRGWTLKGKSLRAAQVVVSSGKPA